VQLHAVPDEVGVITRVVRGCEEVCLKDSFDDCGGAGTIFVINSGEMVD
jgi:hypothetical protein